MYLRTTNYTNYSNFLLVMYSMSLRTTNYSNYSNRVFDMMHSVLRRLRASTGDVGVLARDKKGLTSLPRKGRLSSLNPHLSPLIP